MPATNVPLKQLDTEELRRLAHLQGPCVTIQVPDSHPGASDMPRTALLRQLTQRAIEGLRNLSRTTRADSLAAALRAFVETIDDAGGPGFTVFVAPGLENLLRHSRRSSEFHRRRTFPYGSLADGGRGS